MKIKVTKQEGCGCFTTIGFVLVVLKLFGTINLSWWIVTLPFWGPRVVSLVFMIPMAFIALALRKR